MGVLGILSVVDQMGVDQVAINHFTGIRMNLQNNWA